jgi:hypothetical protein
VAAGAAAATLVSPAAIATKVLLAVAISAGLGGAGLVAYRTVNGQKVVDARPQTVSVATAAREASRAQPLREPAAEPPPEAVRLEPLREVIPAEALREAIAAETLREAIPAEALHEAAPGAGGPSPEGTPATPKRGFHPPPNAGSSSALPLVATTLEAETRLIRAGVAALHAGDPAAALALFEQHALEYPTGVLAEERSAERVIALCDLGRESEARSAAEVFLRDHARSPLADRLRESCAGGSIR